MRLVQTIYGHACTLCTSPCHIHVAVWVRRKRQESLIWRELGALARTARERGSTKETAGRPVVTPSPHYSSNDVSHATLQRIDCCYLLAYVACQDMVQWMDSQASQRGEEATNSSTRKTGRQQDGKRWGGTRASIRMSSVEKNNKKKRHNTTLLGSPKWRKGKKEERNRSLHLPMPPYLYLVRDGTANVARPIHARTHARLCYTSSFPKFSRCSEFLTQLNFDLGVNATPQAGLP